MTGKSTRSKTTAAAASAMDTNAAVANKGVLSNSFYVFRIHMLLQLVLHLTAMLLLLRRCC